MHKKLNRYLPIAFAVLLVTGMAAVSELSGEGEILFPEIAAIAAGALAAPRLAWRTNDLRLFASISAGALLGAAIVRFVPIHPAPQMCLAFLLASAMLLLSGTTFAPMISSIVLPVMLQTRSIVYPISAAVLTGLIILLKKALTHAGLISPADFSPAPLPDKPALMDLLLRWLLGSIVITAAVLTGFKLIAAPPLLVAFTEFRAPGSKAQKQPLSVWAVIAASALTGAVSRYAALSLGIYCFAATALTVTLVLLLMKRTGLFIPPAAALSVLAFLIPEQQLLVYPLLVSVGAAVFIGTAILHGRLSHAQN